MDIVQENTSSTKRSDMEELYAVPAPKEMGSGLLCLCKRVCWIQDGFLLFIYSPVAKKEANCLLSDPKIINVPTMNGSFVGEFLRTSNGSLFGIPQMVGRTSHANLNKIKGKLTANQQISDATSQLTNKHKVSDDANDICDYVESKLFSPEILPKIESVFSLATAGEDGQSSSQFRAEHNVTEISRQFPGYDTSCDEAATCDADKGDDDFMLKTDYAHKSANEKTTCDAKIQDDDSMLRTDYADETATCDAETQGDDFMLRTDSANTSADETATCDAETQDDDFMLRTDYANKSADETTTIDAEMQDDDFMLTSDYMTTESSDNEATNHEDARLNNSNHVWPETDDKWYKNDVLVPDNTDARQTTSDPLPDDYNPELVIDEPWSEDEASISHDTSFFANNTDENLPANSRNMVKSSDELCHKDTSFVERHVLYKEGDLNITTDNLLESESQLKVCGSKDGINICTDLNEKRHETVKNQELGDKSYEHTSNNVNDTPSASAIPDDTCKTIDIFLPTEVAVQDDAEMGLENITNKYHRNTNQNTKCVHHAQSVLEETPLIACSYKQFMEPNKEEAASIK